MEKGYYDKCSNKKVMQPTVAIHNKNGKGLLRKEKAVSRKCMAVAIHNKNGKGLLHVL